MGFSVRYSFGALVDDQALFRGEVFEDERILVQRRKGQLRVGTSRGGEEVEGQDGPQGSGGAKTEGPQSSPRGLLSLKEARGERRSFKMWRETWSQVQRCCNAQGSQEEG